ncbi:hypothetical protein [Streptacidiphilus anmyonensis]|uniref:hypothetical protein n=1 Tax=Streptacidiphilus anmyonensis TaxID=405782 RepID=UPI00128D2653|nr:hypothetical protein [Streptacidiphilus anmyonensis]
MGCWVGPLLGCADGVVGPTGVGVLAGGETATGTGTAADGPELGRAALSPAPLGVAPALIPSPA